MSDIASNKNLQPADRIAYYEALMTYAKKGTAAINQLIGGRLKKSAFYPVVNCPTYSRDTLYELAKQALMDKNHAVEVFHLFKLWLLSDENNIPAMWEIYCELPQPEPEPIKAEDKQVQEEDVRKFSCRGFQFFDVPYDATEQQLIEFFRSEFGEVDKLSMRYYGDSGHPTGNGECTFRQMITLPRVQHVLFNGVHIKLIC